MKLSILYFLLLSLSAFAGPLEYTMEKTRRGVDTVFTSFDSMQKQGTTTTINATPAVKKLVNEHNEPTTEGFNLGAKDPLTKQALLDYLLKITSVAPLTAGTPLAAQYADTTQRLATSMSASTDPQFQSLASTMSTISQSITSDNPVQAQLAGQSITQQLNTDISANKQNTALSTISGSGLLSGTSYTSSDRNAFTDILSAAGSIALGTAVSTLTSAGLTALANTVGLKLPGLSGGIGSISAGAGSSTQQDLLKTGNANQTMTNAGLSATQQLASQGGMSLNSDLKNLVNTSNNTQVSNPGSGGTLTPVNTNNDPAKFDANGIKTNQ